MGWQRIRHNSATEHPCTHGAPAVVNFLNQNLHSNLSLIHCDKSLLSFTFLSKNGDKDNNSSVFLTIYEIYKPINALLKMIVFEIIVSGMFQHISNVFC